MPDYGFVTLRFNGFTSVPVVGDYYLLNDRLHLCVRADAGSYCWFIDAEEAPVLVRSCAQLQATPIQHMEVLHAQ